MTVLKKVALIILFTVLFFVGLAIAANEKILIAMLGYLIAIFSLGGIIKTIKNVKKNKGF